MQQRTTTPTTFWCEFHRRRLHWREVPRLRLRQVKIADSWSPTSNVSGLIGNFVVNDVDVTAFVTADSTGEPGTRAAPGDATADDYRAMWTRSNSSGRHGGPPGAARTPRRNGRRRVVLRRDTAPSRLRIDAGEPHDPRSADAVPPARLTHSSYPPADARARHRPRRASVVRGGDGARASRMALVRHRRQPHRHRARTAMHAFASARIRESRSSAAACGW